ncbi:MAG: malto-oligosyltrehalose trehalohydrolase [Spirochaetaceae bacterium]
MRGSSRPDFSVWAPAAESVEFVTGNAVVPMTRDDSGWWVVPGGHRRSDGRYAYRIDGEGPYPDPRAERLPDGVHAWAEAVDHDAFTWNDSSFRARPLGSGVIYEMHIGTFSDEGTFDSAIEYLAELAELGVTHLNVMPIASSSGGRGWGYDGVGLYAPWEAYGGPDAFKRFVAACHEHDLAVVLDVVYNHLGPEGNYLGRFGPYFTDRYRTPWGEALNLDGPDSDEVRSFLLDNLEYWVRVYRVDGFRLDAVHALHDSSAVHILEDMSSRIRCLELQLGKPLVLIAESDMNNAALVRPVEAGGQGLDAQWSDDFHHAVHCLLTGEHQGYYAGFGSFAQLSKALTRVFVRDGHYAPHRKRRYGRPAGDIPRDRFVHCIQNHDQVGNRAVGERLSHIVSEGRLMIAAALNLLSPAVPMLFQGEEWACSSPFQYFTDHQDDELAQAVSTGRTNEFSDFGWEPEEVPDPQDASTFYRSKLSRGERNGGAHARIYGWYSELIRLRRHNPSLGCACHTHPQVTYNEDERWMLIRRGSYVIGFSLAEAVVGVPVADTLSQQKSGDATFGFSTDDPPLPGSLLLSTAGVTFERETLILPPESIAVLGP